MKQAGREKPEEKPAEKPAEEKPAERSLRRRKARRRETEQRSQREKPNREAKPSRASRRFQCRSSSRRTPPSPNSARRARFATRPIESDRSPPRFSPTGGARTAASRRQPIAGSAIESEIFRGERVVGKQTLVISPTAALRAEYEMDGKATVGRLRRLKVMAGRPAGKEAQEMTRGKALLDPHFAQAIVLAACSPSEPLGQLGQAGARRCGQSRRPALLSPVADRRRRASSCSSGSA